MTFELQGDRVCLSDIPRDKLAFLRSRLFAFVTSTDPLTISAHISQIPEINREFGMSIPQRALSDRFDADYVTKPYRHQILTVNRALNFRRFALLSDMGTGKTKCAIDIARFRLRKGHCHKILVVCPRNLMEVWREQVPLHAREELVVLDGSRARRIELIKLYADSRRWFAVNYEIAFALFGELASAFKGNFIILDEPTKMKSPKARRTFATLRLADLMPYALILSGDIAPESLLDVYCPWYVVDRGDGLGTPKNRDYPQSGWYRFRSRFFVSDYMGWKWKPVNGAESYIKDVLGSRSVRFALDECIDVPTIQHFEIKLDMPPALRKSYNQMEESLYVELEKEGVVVNVGTALARGAKLRQIASGFIYSPSDKGNIAHPLVDGESDMPKLGALMDILDSTKSQVVVWCEFDFDIEMVCRVLATHKVTHVVIKAGETDIEGKLKVFASGAARILVSKPRILGHGHTLTSANVAVYYSRDYWKEPYAQSLKRIVRIGQTSSHVLYYDLIYRGTIDATILKVLQGKMELSDSVMDIKTVFGGGDAV